jgi:hypothetical protein
MQQAPAVRNVFYFLDAIRATCRAMQAWIFSLLVLLAPPERLAAQPHFPGWHETAAQLTTRYESIAADIAAVVETETPIARGKHGREQTAAMLVAVSFLESGWAPDVDASRCYRGRSGRSKRCDSGRAFTIYQMQFDDPVQRELARTDRRAATRIALARIRRSIAACARHGDLARLNAYASGRCDAGQKAGAARIQLARRLLAQHPRTDGAISMQ